MFKKVQGNVSYIACSPQTWATWDCLKKPTPRRMAETWFSYIIFNTAKKEVITVYTLYVKENKD